MPACKECLSECAPVQLLLELCRPCMPELPCTCRHAQWGASLLTQVLFMRERCLGS